jgi:SAM-dependent methyltransferase
VLYGGGDLPIAADAIDCAAAFTVLEHVRDEARTLSELHRVVKPGGVLVVSVPNRWWIFETHGADLPLLPWNRVPFVSWWPRRLHDRFARARIYAKRDIEKLVVAAGFTVAASRYLTAPLDVLRWRPLREALRRSLFGSDATRLPFLATEILVVARKA